MQGVSPKLPLVKDPDDGLYGMNKTLLESIKQDLKMLLLTNPGERMMLPDYGAGIRTLLFSQNNKNLNGEISNKIKTQINKYMRFISVQDVVIAPVDSNENALFVSIVFFIPSINVRDQLNLSLTSN